jgi:hypothetical protein
MLDTLLTGLQRFLKMGTTPVPKPPSPLLLTTTPLRPGLSPLRIETDIQAQLRAAGIPTGTYEDGTPNYEDQRMYILVRALVRDMLENLVVTVAIPPGTPLQATGMAADGTPVQVIGTTIGIATGTGVVQ